MQTSSQPLSPDGRVLIVDDEENVTLLLQRSLARLGPALQVRVAHSGAQALELVKEDPFDLVITDYQMPHMNGLELTRVMRQGCPNVKIILMTAYPSTFIADQVDELAVDAYLVKPFSMRHLWGIVYHLLTSPELPFPSPRGNGHENKESKSPSC